MPMPGNPSERTEHAAAARTTSRRRRTRRSGPPRGVRAGYPWWAYALLALVAIGALVLVVFAFAHDAGTASALGALTGA